MRRKKNLLLILLITILSTILVWLPFAVKGELNKVFANYDGPNYIVIAKCWYNPACIGKNFSLPLPLEYYPAHFPGYPGLITLLDQFLPGWWAMLAASLVGTVLLVFAFYLLLKVLRISQTTWLTIILLFLPARMLILRSIGAPETLFMAALLFSILFFLKKKYLLSGFFLAFAQATKTPAILLFISYGILAIYDISIHRKFKIANIKKISKYYGLVFGPAVILPIFWLFQKQTGDFFAYFHSGDNFHLFFPPFQSLISSQAWLGDFWLEDIIYIYLIGGVAVLALIRKYKWSIISIFPTIFYLSTLFVAHRDISRYSAPLYPFWIIAFAPLLRRREFKIVFWLLLPAIYLYAINFISYNTAPIADWTPYY
jgi:Gpi18-like mannosyltransferase